MCQVIEHAYRQCKHHHHWELAIPCQLGFHSKRKRCNGRNHEVVLVKRRDPQRGPVCCRQCLGEKQECIKQVFIMKLIRLKAATMYRSCSDAELAWRFQTWSKQASKEYIRTLLANGYSPDNEEDYESAGNMNEDEYDRGWFFPVSQDDLDEQMRDVRDRIDRGDECPEYDFWYDRADDTDKDRKAGLAADDNTVIEVKLAPDNHQAITDNTVEGEEEDEEQLTDQCEGEEQDGELTDDGSEEDEKLTDDGKEEDDDESTDHGGENEEEEENETIDIHAQIVQTRALLTQCTNNLERLEEIFNNQSVNRNTSD